MLTTKNLYQKYASYIDKPSLEFFLGMSRIAYRRFKEGRQVQKNDCPVVYGTTIRDFDPEHDGVIARVEMNQRGILRDFIGIDWDFEAGEEARLEQLDAALQAFHERHRTPVIIYPTHSYPSKPRVRTVMFTGHLMDAEEYARAVSYVVRTLGVDPGDDGNYNIKHNFNLPVINSPEQKERMTLLQCEENLLLTDALWAGEKPKVKGWTQRPAKHHPVFRMERETRSREQIDAGLDYLSRMMHEGARTGYQNVNKGYDFSKWGNFFQFLHSVARAECLGAITRDDALYILQRIAGGNHSYERRNVEDYLREYPRVASSDVKLECARPLSWYFGVTGGGWMA